MHSNITITAYDVVYVMLFLQTEFDRRFEQNIDTAKRPPTISTQCSACRMVASEIIKSVKNKVSNDVRGVMQSL